MGTTRKIAWFLLTLPLLAACPRSGLVAEPTLSSVSEPDDSSQGYRLAVHAMACWLGSLWSDMEGYTAPRRQKVTGRHCRQAAQLTLGDENQANTMRVMDETVVTKVAERIGNEGGGALARLVRSVAAAEREARAARQAAGSLRQNLNDPKEATELSQDEREVVGLLHASEALTGLFKFEGGGEIAGDIEAIALLLSVQRIETGRGLPRHLRLSAIEDPSRLVFGVQPSAEHKDLNQPIGWAEWLAYLDQVAQAAGHPVPQTITRQEDRAMLAYNGILKGVADRLRNVEGKLSKGAPRVLRRAVAGAIRRLDDDYQQARRAVRVSAE